MEENESIEQVYTIPEIAAILKCHQETVRLKMQKGILGGFKLGNRWRIRESVLREYMEGEKIKEA